MGTKSSVTDVPIWRGKSGHRDRDTCEDGGRGWSYDATSQGHQGLLATKGI